MDETTVPVVDTPTEQETTESYIEQRREGKTEDLPVPPPTIPEVIPPPPVPEQVEAPKHTDQQAVDAYLEQRRGEKERKRGGKQARIDELTKQKAELEAKVAAAVPVPEAPKAEVVSPPVVVPPVTAPVEVPKSRPKMDQFDDVDAYHAAMALWAVEERSRSAAAPTPPVVEAPKPETVSPIRKEEFDKFLENGKRFIAGHADFNTTLEAAHIRGLTMTEGARVAITRLAAPEVAYWLAKPENDMAARRFMGLDEMQQVVEVGRIAERLAVSPADYVSSAPTPGIRLTNGNTRSTVPLSELSTDDYIRERKQQRRANRGR